MVDLASELHQVGEEGRADSFELFARSLDSDWVERILEANGAATVRRRKLPAEFVVWLVIGMALLRDRSVTEVVHHLELVLPDGDSGSGERRTGGPGVSVTSSAIAQARSRLGAQPLRALFESTAQRWSVESADAQRWRGLAVYGVDGTTLRVQDTEENEREFGRPKSGRAPGAYPQLRLIALMVLGIPRTPGRHVAAVRRRRDHASRQEQ